MPVDREAAWFNGANFGAAAATIALIFDAAWRGDVRAPFAAVGISVLVVICTLHWRSRPKVGE